VTDNAGSVGTDTIVVKVGNKAPEVNIVTSNNKSFYWNNKPFKYSVQVSDKEDRLIKQDEVKVTFDYTAKPSASNTSTALPLGYTLIAGSDCKACHTLDKVSVGPSYKAVAEKYKGQSGALSMLAKKIIAGGGGNWGKEHVMAAHPQISVQDANEMVSYILSLADAKKSRTISRQGTLTLTDHKDDEPRGIYTLTASYTDHGANNIDPITKDETIVLRNAKVRTVFADEHTGFRRFGNNLSGGSHKAFIMLRNIDLNGIRKFTYEYASKNRDGEIEVRIDSQAGPVISNVSYTATGAWDKTSTVTSDISSPVSGRHDIYFFVLKRDKPNDDIINLKTIQFEE
jgi:cytochrome c